MSRRLQVVLWVVIASALAVSPGWATPAWVTYHTADGVGVTIPPDWEVTVSPSGLLVVAGPKAPWGRPVISVVVVAGPGEGAALTARVTPLIGDPSQLHVLGSQQLRPDRTATYYLRSEAGQNGREAYVMVGTISGKKFSAVAVGIDPTSDPDLRLRAGVLQALLLRLELP